MACSIRMIEGICGTSRPAVCENMLQMMEKELAEAVSAFEWLAGTKLSSIV